MTIVIIIIAIIVIAGFIYIFPRWRKSSSKRKELKVADSKLFRWMSVWLLTYSKNDDKKEQVTLISRLIKQHFSIDVSTEELSGDYDKYSRSSTDSQKYTGFESQMLSGLKEYSTLRFTEVDKSKFVNALIALAMVDQKIDESEFGFIAKICDALDFGKDELEKASGA